MQRDLRRRGYRQGQAQHPLVAALARDVPLGAAILEDLEAHGPAADVWTPLAGGEDQCPWYAL
jgi:hypothetical protein